MSYEQREPAVRFPFATADNTNAQGVQRIAITGAAQTFLMPQNMRGKFLYFYVDGAGSALTKVQVAVAASAQSLVLNQPSSAAAGTSSAAAGVTVAPGAYLDRAIANDATHICWIGDVAAGFVEIYISEPCIPRS